MFQIIFFSNFGYSFLPLPPGCCHLIVYFFIDLAVLYSEVYFLCDIGDLGHHSSGAQPWTCVFSSWYDKVFSSAVFVSFPNLLNFLQFCHHAPQLSSTNCWLIPLLCLTVSQGIICSTVCQINLDPLQEESLRSVFEVCFNLRRLFLVVSFLGLYCTFLVALWFRMLLSNRLKCQIKLPSSS